MKGSAFLEESEGATRRAERVSDPIDEQIASLLESVSTKQEAQAVMDPDVGRDPAAASDEPPATALTNVPSRPRRPRSTGRRTTPRARLHRLTERLALVCAVWVALVLFLDMPSSALLAGLVTAFALAWWEAFPGIAIDLPRPSTVRLAFSLIAILFGLSIAVGFLIVYLT